MAKNNLYNSKIFRFFDYCFRLVLINLLIIIPSFLLLFIFEWFFKNQLSNHQWLYIVILIPALLWFFPSICAGVDLVTKYELKLTDGLFKEFFKSLKKIYLKSMITSVILVVAVVLFYNSLTFFYQNIEEGLIYLFGFFLTISFCIIALIILIHIPLVMSYMDGCAFYHDYSLAAMMAFKDLGISLAIAACIAVDVWLAVNFVTVLIIGGISAPIYLIVKLTFKKYYIVYIRTHKNKNEEI